MEIGSPTDDGELPPKLNTLFGIASPPLITAIRTVATPDPVTCTVSSRTRSIDALAMPRKSALQRLIVFVCEQSRGDSPGSGIWHGIVSDAVTGPTVNVLVVGTQPLQPALLTAAAAQVSSIPDCGVPKMPRVALAE